MEIPDQFLDQVKAWENKQLNPEESSRFETSIAEDGAWYATYRQYVRARKAIDGMAEAETKAAWKKEYFNEGNAKKPRRLWSFFAVAAGILLLIGGSLFFSENNDTAQLYQQYTEQLVLSPGQRGGEATDELLLQANTLFNQQEFQAAIPALEQILADTAFLRRDYALLHLGLCHQNLGEFDQATSAFEQIDTQSAFRYDSMWYQALIAWKQGDEGKAKELFEKLMKESKTWGKQAGKFLEALQSNP